MTIFNRLLCLMSSLMPLSAMANDAISNHPTNVSRSSYLVSVSTSQCTKQCDGKYDQCAKGKTGKDMKQCAEERRVCYSRCSAAASRADCTKGCEGKYAQCGKSNGGKDMKQCSSERKVCYARCA